MVGTGGGVLVATGGFGRAGTGGRLLVAAGRFVRARTGGRMFVATGRFGRSWFVEVISKGGERDVALATEVGLGQSAPAEIVKDGVPA